MLSLRRNAVRTGVTYEAADELAPEDLDRQLATERGRADAQRRDELARAQAEAAHRRDRANVGVQTRIEDLARAEQVAEAESAARIARTYREAVAAGERLRIESQMRRSGEARSLILEKLRSLNIKSLVPVLLAFGAWSATGVQHGAARVMSVGADDVMWWVLWLLEPALLGAVAWIIIARARLASAGGRLEPQAEVIGAGCLLASIVLNVIAALPEQGEHWTGATVGDVFAHILGPVGAAVTAYLLGVVDRSITAADPWTLANGDRAPSLAKMDLRPPRITLGTASETAPGSTVETASVGASEPVRRPRRTAADQGGQTGSEAPRRTRPNRGVPVPALARDSADEPSPRALSDEDLMIRLSAMIAADEVPAAPSIRSVQEALGLGFARAKRVMELAGLSTGNEGQDDEDGAEVAA